MSSLSEINTKADYERVLDREPAFIVLFTAPGWCVPCQQLKPHYESAAEVSDLLFAYIDVDKAERDLLELYGVMGVPRMFFVTQTGFYEVQSRSGPTILQEIQSIRDSM